MSPYKKIDKYKTLYTKVVWRSTLLIFFWLEGGGGHIPALLSPKILWCDNPGAYEHIERVF